MEKWENVFLWIEGIKDLSKMVFLKIYPAIAAIIVMVTILGIEGKTKVNSMSLNDWLVALAISFILAGMTLAYYALRKGEKDDCS